MARVDVTEPSSEDVGGEAEYCHIEPLEFAGLMGEMSLVSPEYRRARLFSKIKICLKGGILLKKRLF